jgi:hypothetical protein
MVEAHNLHQIDSVLAYFTEDAYVSQENNWTQEGEKNIRNLEEWDSVNKSQWIFSDLRFSEDTVFFSAKETSRWLASAGIGSVLYDSAFAVIEESKISGLYFRLSPESQAASQQIVKDVFNWAKGTDEMFALNKILPSGQLKIDGESAQEWLEMMERRSQMSE